MKWNGIALKLPKPTKCRKTSQTSKELRAG